MKIVKKDILFATRYLNFVGFTFLNNNNKEEIWYSAERHNQGKTVLIAARVENKLVVTKEFRVPIGDYEWGLPAGLVDGDELPAETAKRELKEETNLDLESISEITPYLTNTAGMTNEVVSIVYCTAKGSVNALGNEQTEDIQCFLLDKEQLSILLQDKNKKFSAKAYLIFRQFLEKGSW